MARENNTSMTWREFVHLVQGVFAADSRMSRHFARPQTDEEVPDAV